MPANPIPTPADAVIRHGRRAGGCIVQPDESDWFQSLLASLLARLKPADEVEASLVESLAVLELKLVRLDVLELRTVAGDEGEQAGRLPPLGTLVRYRARLLKERWEIDHRLRLLAASRCTNEAEAKGAPAGSAVEAWAARRLALDAERQRQATAGATAPLNRHERRRMAAGMRQVA
jgi:hypothetical protein